VADIFAGYTGYAEVGGQILRFSSASLGVQQDVITPDMAEGTRRRYGYAYGGATASGSLSGPLVAGQASPLWDLAIAAEEEEVFIEYYTGTSSSFTCIINSFGVSCSAGDVAQYTMDFIGGEGSGNTGGGTPPSEEVLLTWDQLNPDGFNECEVQAFDVSLNNNCTPVYGLGQGSLWPCKILPGKLTVTGSLTIYGVPGNMDAEDQLSAIASGTIEAITGIPGMHVLFSGIAPQGSVGPVVYTRNFNVYR
jgi:hypothetical protein